MEIHQTLGPFVAHDEREKKIKDGMKTIPVSFHTVKNEFCSKVHYTIVQLDIDIYLVQCIIFLSALT